MIDEHEEMVIGKVYDRRMMRRLIKYLFPYKSLVLLAVVLIVSVAGLEVLGPYITKTTIDKYIRAGDLSGLNGIALLYLLLLLAIFCLEYLQTYITYLIGQRTMYDLRMEIFAHIQRLDMSYFDRTPVGKLMTRITSDIDAINELFTSGVVTIFGDVVMLSGIVVALFLMNYKLALAVFSVIPLIFLVTFVFRIKVRDTYRLVRKCVARLNAFLQESITGMTVIQLFVKEKSKFNQFDKINRDHLDANLLSIFYYAVFYPAIELIGALSIALVIWYGGTQVLRQALTLGALVAFIQYSERFFKPISDLTEKYNTLQTAMASAERIFGLLDTEVKIKSPDRPAPVGSIKSNIEFRNVWFAYKDEDYVLKDVSFSVKEGERVAIVGATGAGKTSIINLLTRFYDVQRGEILIDGINVKDFELHTLRRLFGIVLQDVFLFSGTVEDNIKLGHNGIPLDRIHVAVKTVHADRFIARLTKGFQEEVRERGSSFSVGEKQLLAFARALAFDPKVLILDEATSSVDTETELLIRDALRKLMQGRTSIVIAHRLSTIQDVDRIIVLHKGIIREMGTHKELLERKGIYYRLYQLQYKDQYVNAPPVS